MCFWRENQGLGLPPQLTQGLENYALKNDQVLGLLQVGLRLRGQARYSLDALHPLSNKSSWLLTFKRFEPTFVQMQHGQMLLFNNWVHIT